jgi:AraC-like DNA-binding protein
MSNGQIQIPLELRSCIRNFWTLETDGADDEPNTFKVFADGCPGIIFQHPEKGMLFQDDKKLPPFFLYGQATKASEIRLCGKFSTVGIYFYPNALKSIFGINAEELTNSCIDLDLLNRPQGFSLLEQLSNAPSVTDQARILSSFIFSLVRKKNDEKDMEMKYALTQIMQSKGAISLAGLRRELQISERSFERRFKLYVGISPKLFSRISRFQASLDQLRQYNFNKLSDIAYENDYADQSHFIRAFREFAGYSPFQYQKRCNEVVENLSGLIK